MAVPLGPRGNETSQRLEDRGRLLPGIPNEITLSQIAPKLSWRDVRSLSSVNSRWWHAIRSREVYDERVRLHSTQTLVLLSYRPRESGRAIGLYSMTENRCYQLPSIPHLDKGILSRSQFVSLDGKIYVVGGEVSPFCACGNVYVLDLAGKMQWKQCASLITPRGNFGCGVVNGKLYVFGGWVCGEAVCGSEAYDPKGDTWSPIKAIPDLRFDHNVATLGAKLLVHGGNVLRNGYSLAFDPKVNFGSTNCLKGTYHRRKVVSNQMYKFRGCLVFAEPVETQKSLVVYDAVKDEWSVLEAGRRHKADVSFIGQGKLHSMTSDDIHVLDLETNSWTHLHSHSFAACGLFDAHVQSVLAEGDHLLAIVEGTDLSGQFRQVRLLRSRGLGSTNSQIEWERVRLTFDFEEHGAPSDYSMHQVQL